MLAKSLKFLARFLEQEGVTVVDNVHLANIATAVEQNDTVEGVICTLVNVEEEFTKKNYPPPRRENAAGIVDYLSPPLYLNLYILFSVRTANTGYETALATLSKILACFQAKSSFTISNSGFNPSEEGNAFSITEEAQFKLDLELYSLTFEQLNHLWGTLGGKQYPSVLYKVRLVQLQKERKQGTGRRIQEVSLNAKA